MSKSYYNRDNKYTSTNYVDVFKMLVPDMYFEEDLDLSGTQSDPLDDIINSHINICNNLDKDKLFGDVNQSGGSALARYFIKQNNLTHITPFNFEKNVLNPSGYTLSGFTTSAAFKEFVSGTLLGSLQGQAAFSKTHLGLFAFLNQHQAGGGVTRAFEPSSYVVDRLVDTVFQGKTLETVDGIIGITRHLWLNQDLGVSTAIVQRSLPGKFVKGTDEFTSGTQNLERLETLIDVLYSDRAIDESDRKVANAFNKYFFSRQYLGLSASEPLPSEFDKRPLGRENAGPLSRFLKAASFQTADLIDKVDRLGDIYNIDRCPEEHLDLLADLIGWEFYTQDIPSRRAQLKSAINVYKQIGTSGAMKTLTGIVFGKDTLQATEAKFTEVWESYVPYLIFYCLMTECPYLKDMNTWTSDLAKDIGIRAWSPSSIEDNARIMTDYILLDLVLKNMDNFNMGGERWPVPHFVKLPVSRPTPNPAIQELVSEEEIYSIIHPGMTKNFGFLNDSEENRRATSRFAEEFGHQGEYMIPQVGPAGRGWYFTDINFNEDSRFLAARGSANFVFNYRRHPFGFPIPPFEEFLYYKDVGVPLDLLQDIVISLQEFGVSRSTAEGLLTYVTDSLRADDDTVETDYSDPQAESDFGNFLFFTNNMRTPPNYKEALKSPTKYRPEYMPYWNSKSSHFMVTIPSIDSAGQPTIDTGSDLTSDSTYALQTYGQAAKAFSPAKAIPKVSLLEKQNHGSHFKDNDTSTGDEQVVSLNDGNEGNTYSDGFQTATEEFFLRDGENMPIGHSYGGGGTWDLGRNPGEGGTFHPIVDATRLPRVYRSEFTRDSNLEFQGQHASDTRLSRGWRNLGSNLKMSEELDELDPYDHRFNGNSVIKLAKHIYNDRLRIMGANWFIEQEGIAEFATQSKWKKVGESYAEQLGANLPNFEEFAFSTFDFGAELFKIYEIWADPNIFNQHPIYRGLIKDTQLAGPAEGFNIISHTFGPLVENGLGHLAGSSTGLVRTNFDSSAPRFVASAGDMFSEEGPASFGSYKVTTIAEYDAGKSHTLMLPSSGVLADCTPNPFYDEAGTTPMREFSNMGVLSGVELVIPDLAGSVGHFFEVYKFSGVGAADAFGTNIALDSHIVRSKATTVPLRIRYRLGRDIPGWGVTDGTTRTNNFRSDTSYELTLSSLFVNDSGTTAGGGTVGVWIHTEPLKIKQAQADGGDMLMASYIPGGLHDGFQGHWVTHSVEQLSTKQVLDDLCFKFTHDFEVVDTSPHALTHNAGLLAALSTPEGEENDRLTDLIHGDRFVENKLKFHTFNGQSGDGPGSPSYPMGLHRLHNQTDDSGGITNYVVEIIHVPDAAGTQTMFYNGVSIIDEELNNLTRMQLPAHLWPIDPETGEPSQNTELVKSETVINREHLYDFLKYQNSLASDANLHMNRGESDYDNPRGEFAVSNTGETYVTGNNQNNADWTVVCKD